MNCKAILFDFNGVIVDDESVHEAAFRAVVEDIGKSLTHAQYLQHFSGRTDEDGWLSYLGMTQSLGGQVEFLCKAKTVYFQQFASDKNYLYPEVEGVLIEVRELGMKIGLITGTVRTEVDAALAGLSKHIELDVIVTADDQVSGKPSPDSYLLGASRLGVLPEECVAVEDTPAGIRAAKRAGMFCIAITSTHPRQGLAEADMVVDSLKEIGWPLLRGGIKMFERYAA